MNPAISAAIETVNSKNEPVIYYASINSANIFKTSLVIAISDSHIYILNLNGKVKQVFSFYDLIGITIDGSTVTFKFDKTEYSIFVPETDKLCKCIFDVIGHIFTMKEQHKLTITNFRVERNKNNGISALFRLKAIYQNPNLENFKSMETILVSSQPCVSYNQFVDQANFLPHFMTILPLCPYIKSLILTKVDGIDHYQYLASACQNELYLKHLLVQGPVTSKFNEFIGNLQINRNSNLFGLGFSESNLTSDKLSLLSNFIKVSGLKSIEFHDAIANDEMISFYNTFLTSEIFDTIFMINFSGTKNLNISQLFPKIKSVKMLCLSNCDLEISDVFDQVSQLSELKVLDISRNQCSSKIDPDAPITFPPLLDTINVSYTDFGQDCAVSLIKFLFNHFENGLNLSVASLAPPESLEWKSILSCINHSTYRSLVSLTWDKNIIHSKLFAFLLKNPNLRNVSLNSCISSGSATDAMASVALFIQASKSLVNLSLRGDSSNYIGNNLEALFAYIPYSKTLETLDITYSRCGDAGLNQITNFLTKCTSLKNIIIDGMRPKSASPLFNLAKLSYGIRDQLKLSYPYNDIEKLFNDGVLTKRGKSELKHFFEIDEGSDSYFLKPYRVYRYFLFDEFPLFLDDEQVAKIYENRPLLDEVPPPLPQENEKKSQSNTRTEILDFDNIYSSKRSRIRPRNFNVTYALTPNSQARPNNFWSRDVDFSKTLPTSALSAPVSPVVAYNNFGDSYRRADVYDEPIKRVKSPHSTRQTSSRPLRTTINIFKDDDDGTKTSMKTKPKSSSQRARSTNSSPKDSKNTDKRSRRPRNQKDNGDSNDEDQNVTKKSPQIKKARTPQSQRRPVRKNEIFDSDEDLVERSPKRSTPSSRKTETQQSTSQRNTPTLRRSRRPQNEQEDDEDKQLVVDVPTKRRIHEKTTTTTTKVRSRTPTSTTKRTKRIEVIEEIEEEIESRKTPTPKRKKLPTPTSPNSSHRNRSVNSTPKSRRSQNQHNFSDDIDDDEQDQVQKKSPKRTTRKRTQNRA